MATHAHHAPDPCRYAELHCKTNYSFLEGASHATELVERAKQLGYQALAITDRNSLAGIVRAHQAAKEYNMTLIVGSEITPMDSPPIVLWATDRKAYGRLTRLLTVGRLRTDKGKCKLTWDDVAEHADGLLAGLVTYHKQPSESVFRNGAEYAAADIENTCPAAWDGNRTSTIDSASRAVGTLSNSAVAATDFSLFTPQTEYFAGRFHEVFKDRAYLLAAAHRGSDDAWYLEQVLQFGRRHHIPIAATGDVHYHAPCRLPLHDVLTAIRFGTTVSRIGPWRLPNAERHLRHREEIQHLFAQAPGLLQRTLEIAGRCSFSLDELRYEYPECMAPEGLTPLQHLQQLAWTGAHKRYPSEIPDKVRRLIEHELELIEQLRYEAYFLTVWDLVRFARRRGILCQGRGSAANSAVCYCLGITSVDPAQMDVLFERFVSRERDEAPDIDVDFEHERREEVLQYLYDKYGRHRAALTAEVIRYRSRSAIRDVGKALGLSLDRVDALAKQVEGYTHEPNLAERCRDVGIDPASDLGLRLILLVNQLIGFPRHLSQHVGGMVITQGPLCELVPIENAAMTNRTVIQWDKDDLDILGILKIDCLALGMLTAIRRCFDLVKRHHQRTFTLATVPADDHAVYDMICRADTMGVFQIESRAQMSMLPRLKPRCYYDLVIEVAIVRPGPIQGQMVHPYLKRRAGQQPITYPNQSIRAVLHKTLGIPIFQEQAMRLAVVAAGFTPGEADQLRRAMGAWRRAGVIERFRGKLLSGMQTRGLSREFAEQVFRQIRGFGEYGFPESHAASFALLVYVSAWLKHHYPAAFAAALLNSQPMGFYQPAQLIQDARRHGVPVRPIDINFSEWNSTLESVDSAAPDRFGAVALRLGFQMIKSISRNTVTEIERARHQHGAFRSIHDFTRRTSLRRADLLLLARADVFQSLDRNRRSAIWDVLEQNTTSQPRPLFDGLADEDDPDAVLPTMPAEQEVLEDYQTTRLSLKAHPLALHRERMEQMNVVTAQQLAHLQNGRSVHVAGLVLLRQRPSTAKGITFVTLEDETGTINLVVHQAVWQRHYTIARRAPAWLVKGRLESKEGIIHVVVNRLEDLSTSLATPRLPARDFR